MVYLNKASRYALFYTFTAFAERYTVMKKTPTPTPKRFHNLREMLDTVCKENPQKSAFYIKSGVKFRSITYSRLRSDTRSFGSTLMQRGLTGKKILLVGDNCYQWALSYLTVLCGLGIIIPIDKDAPDADICEIAKASSAAAVIYSPKYESKISALPKKLQRISFDEISVFCEHGMSYSDKELNEFDSLSIDADEVATILFSKSNSESAKGVMLSQRNLCAALEGLSIALPEEKDGITLALLPLHSAYESIMGLLSPISRGTAVAFIESIKSTMQNAKELSPTSIVCSPAIIERAYRKMWANIRKRNTEEKVTSLIKATDSIKIPALQKKAKKKLFSDIHNAFGGRLETIIIGGSSVDREVVSGMKSFGFNVIQAYGTAECSALIAITPKNASEKDGVGTVFPIGELKIAEPDGNGVGEICYRGDNVMLGYYKQEDLSKEIKQNGWIRTGDLGSIDSDGYLSIMGRKKNAISAPQNRRIYPEELETLISRIPYVKECIIIGIKKREGNSNDIVAIISPDRAYASEALGVYASRPMIKEKISASIADINSHLPQYKRISYSILLDDDIPKNPYKKIERSSLADFIIREYL